MKGLIILFGLIGFLGFVIGDSIMADDEEYRRIGTVATVVGMLSLISCFGLIAYQTIVWYWSIL